MTIIRFVVAALMVGILIYLNKDALLNIDLTKGTGKGKWWEEYWEKHHLVPMFVLSLILLAVLYIPFGDWMEENLLPHWGKILFFGICAFLAGSVLVTKDSKKPPFKKRLAKLTLAAVLLVFLTTVFGSPTTWPHIGEWFSFGKAKLSSNSVVANTGSPDLSRWIAPPDCMQKADPEVVRLATELFVPEHPDLMALLNRESCGQQFEKDGSVLRAKEGDHEALGAMQIKASTAKESCSKQNDIATREGNLKCAIEIKMKSGLDPWPAPSAYKKLEFPMQISSEKKGVLLTLNSQTIHFEIGPANPPVPVRRQLDNDPAVTEEPNQEHQRYGDARYLQFWMLNKQPTTKTVTMIWVK